LTGWWQRHRWGLTISLIGAILLWAIPALAGGGGTGIGGGTGGDGAMGSFPFPQVTIEAGQADTPQEVSTGLQLLFLLTLLSLAPSIIILATGFTRIVIVMGLVRNALGTQNLPPNQVIVGLSLILTFFVMGPVIEKVNVEALQPFLKEEITYQEGIAKAQVPIREFMFNNTRGRDLKVMMELARLPAPATRADVPSYVLLPSFVLSELKTAFQMGFVVYMPFLIIDLVVSSTLMSMGMIFLPPVLISLPFKILLFVMTDGWVLIARSLVTSFRY